VHLPDIAILQMVIDLALLAAVMILLWRVNAHLKKPLLKEQEEKIRELKTLVAESQSAAEIFLRKLEESRLALRETALELDLREKWARKWLAQSGPPASEEPAPKASGVMQDKYAKVVAMIQNGTSEAQTAAATGFTEAEIALIVDLDRIKNGNT